jgi:hypothetical protein
LLGPANHGAAKPVVVGVVVGVGVGVTVEVGVGVGVGAVPSVDAVSVNEDEYCLTPDTTR